MPDIISLDIQRRPRSEDRVEWFRAFVVRAVTTLQSLIASLDEPEDATLLVEIDQLLAVFTGRGRLEIPEDLGVACLERCQAVAERIRNRRAEQRREMTAIVALVRDAVSTVESEISSMHSSIEQSTDRFEAIAEMDDPRLIKELLLAQVTVLKRVTAERRAAWEAKQQALQQRMAQLEQQLQTTRRAATLDALTGAANRGSFDQECVARIERPGSRFVLAMLDLDNLKQINDTHGHAVGDRALIALAQGLRRNLRDDDFIARLGGDEFAVLLNNLSLRQAEIRFSATLARLFAPQEGAEPLPCVPTVSCGLAELSAGDTVASLYERADQALYAAKHQGKNRVAVKERAYLRDLMRR